jgi:Sulfotransferase family
MDHAANSPENEEFEEDRLVWIFGSSRSGSTWLLRMLEELDGAVTVDDPHLGHHLGVWRPIPLAWSAAETRPDLATLTDIRRGKPDYFFADRYSDVWRPLLRQLIAGRFAAQAAEAGRRAVRVIVKEPASQAADILLSLFPGSRLIFLLRDGRDVVDSWLAGYGDGAWAQDEGAFPLAAHGREAFIRWQASVWAYRVDAVARAYARHDPERRVLVRYEDLLSDPETALDRICVATKITRRPSRIERVADGHRIEAVPQTKKGPSHRIRAASPGGWRRSMTAYEQSAMLEEMGEMLLKFGYVEPGELGLRQPRSLRSAA